MKFKFHKKGTDKPIEIFVALFIILAVALIVILMFSGQVSQKRKDMKNIEAGESIKMTLRSARQSCQDVCTNALENDCNELQKAQFCVKFVMTEDKDGELKEGIDLNDNGYFDDYDTQLLGGFAVCEDKVYCSQLVDCTCKVALNMDNCIQILCEYWEGQGVGDINSLLIESITPGSCYSATDVKHWYNNLQKNSCTCEDGQTRTCGTDVGVCQSGTQTCSASTWGTCVGAIMPSTEICDNSLDEDCDGVADDGCSSGVCTDGQTQSCTTGQQGICSAGTQTCSGGAWGTCIRDNDPIAEICGNSLDDDCDGTPDDGCTSCTNGATMVCDTGEDGICSIGTQTCFAGSWGVCVRDNNPTSEICGNGLDDDCDGTPDDSCTSTEGVTRVFSKTVLNPGEQFNVDLIINIGASDTYYVIDETVPSEFTITAGDTGTGNNIMLAVIMSAVDNTYTYTVQAPATAGTYVFSGEYQFETMGSTVPILGPTTVTVI